MSLVEPNDHEMEEEPPKTNPRVLGLGLMAGAGCFLTIGNVIVQYAHKKMGKSISTFEILFIRSLIQMLFIVAFMVYGKVSVYGKSLRNLIVLSVMGVAEVISFHAFLQLLSIKFQILIDWIFTSRLAKKWTLQIFLLSSSLCTIFHITLS